MRIRAFQTKAVVASGVAGDFPSASGFYNTEEIDVLTVGVKQGGAVATTVTFTFADSAGNTVLTLSKALAATAVQKLISLGDVKKAAASDLLAAGDDLAQFMALPPRVRVSVDNAATTKDVVIVGRG